MGDNKKSEAPVSNPVQRVFHVSVLLFGAVIALNLTIAFLRPVLPWLVGAVAAAFVVWLVVTIVRWRRSRW